MTPWALIPTTTENACVDNDPGGRHLRRRPGLKRIVSAHTLRPRPTGNYSCEVGEGAEVEAELVDGGANGRGAQGVELVGPLIAPLVTVTIRVVALAGMRGEL